MNTNSFDYKISKEFVFSYIDKIDNLILINPDNPSGSYISYNDLIEIIAKFNQEGKKIIIDESFIDFADEDKRYSLIDDNILDEYEKLIVIKSISKSYGVPGLRLGVLATSNRDIISTIKDNMPVWNINSFAEYFLQIFVPYNKKYVESCTKIVDARNEFISELNKISFIKTYDSQANYIMIKLLNINSSELTLFLLNNYNILIKDLSNKDGFEKGNFIRIAVKSKDENRLLISALKDYEERIIKK